MWPHLASTFSFELRGLRPKLLEFLARAGELVLKRVQFLHPAALTFDGRGEFLGAGDGGFAFGALLGKGRFLFRGGGLELLGALAQCGKFGVAREEPRDLGPRARHVGGSLLQFGRHFIPLAESGGRFLFERLARLGVKRRSARRRRLAGCGLHFLRRGGSGCRGAGGVARSCRGRRRFRLRLGRRRDRREDCRLSSGIENGERVAPQRLRPHARDDANAVVRIPLAPVVIHEVPCISHLPAPL